MEFLLIILVAGLVFWALTAAAKVRDAEGGSGCCGGSCHSQSSSDSCGSEGGCGSGD